MNGESTNTKPASRELQPIYLIMLGIAAWAVILAGGVVWYDYTAGAVNWWKPLIIVIATTAFLGVWATALRRR